MILFIFRLSRRLSSFGYFFEQTKAVCIIYLKNFSFILGYPSGPHYPAYASGPQPGNLFNVFYYAGFPFKFIENNGKT
jgi:hypothetical protein